MSSAPYKSPVVPSAPAGVAKRVRIAHLHEMKSTGRAIAMVTAYDACFAALADQAGIDVILVGDSVGMVSHGFESTIPVTMDMMVLHTRSVCAGARRPLVVADLPFLSYQTSVDDAVRNAGRLVQEGGAQAVKIEYAGERSLDAVRAITSAGIPVMGHVGLVPQSVHAISGYRVQGRDAENAERIRREAIAQQDAGAFAIVLECIPRGLAASITTELRGPTIGIGAGAACDGQVLVMHDLLGLTPKPPKFARKYANLGAGVVRAFRKYARDVRERTYPGEEHGVD